MFRFGILTTSQVIITPTFWCEFENKLRLSYPTDDVIFIVEYIYINLIEIENSIVTKFLSINESFALHQIISGPIESFISFAVIIGDKEIMPEELNFRKFNKLDY